MNRGFHHNATGVLLCPAGVDWSNPEYISPSAKLDFDVTNFLNPEYERGLLIFMQDRNNDSKRPTELYHTIVRPEECKTKRSALT